MFLFSFQHHSKDTECVDNLRTMTTDSCIRRKLVEGIVKLVNDIVEYQSEVSIRGFIKITSDNNNVLPLTLRESRRRDSEEKLTFDQRKESTVAGRILCEEIGKHAHTQAGKRTNQEPPREGEERESVQSGLKSGEERDEGKSNQCGEASICSDDPEETLQVSKKDQEQTAENKIDSSSPTPKSGAGLEQNKRKRKLSSCLKESVEDKSATSESRVHRRNHGRKNKISCSDDSEQQTSQTPKKLRYGSLKNEHFPCVICEGQNTKSTFQSEYHLFTHGKVKHRDLLSVGYKCKDCEQTFPSFFRLHNHSYQVHLQLRNYTCSRCDKLFTWARELKKHADAHSSLKFTCTKCPWPGKQFHNYSKFICHLKTGHIEQECRKCFERFSSKEELKAHFQDVHVANRKKRRRIHWEELFKQKTVKEVKSRQLPKPQVGLKSKKDVVFVRKVNRKGKEAKVT